MKLHTFRLRNGQDLRQEIQKFADKNNIQAGFIVTCVGGLQKAVPRMADATPQDQVVNTYDEKFEIVSLVGTVSAHGSHLHISLSDKNGKTIGGHLRDGSIVAYTAEIVIGEDPNVIYTHEPDSETGFNELKIQTK